MVVSTQDYFAHHKCLDHVVKYYKSKMMTGLKRVRLYTDGCPAQYACRQNFYKVADFPQRHNGLLLEHVVAIRYCFKGTHDGAGKLSTHFCQNAEKAGVIVDAETGATLLQVAAAFDAVKVLWSGKIHCCTGL